MLETNKKPHKASASKSSALSKQTFSANKSFASKHSVLKISASEGSAHPQHRNVGHNPLRTLLSMRRLPAVLCVVLPHVLDEVYLLQAFVSRRARYVLGSTTEGKKRKRCNEAIPTWKGK